MLFRLLSVIVLASTVLASPPEPETFSIRPIANTEQCLGLTADFQSQITTCGDKRLRWVINNNTLSQQVRQATLVGICLDTSDSENELRLTTRSCEKAQNWSYTSEHQLKIDNGQGMCMDLVNGHTSTGSAVIQWACQPGSKNQVWELHPEGPEFSPLD